MMDYPPEFPALENLPDLLPIAITLLDVEGRIIWYSRNAPNFVERKPDLIGRDVRSCHKPDSTATIDWILDDYKNGGRGEYAWQLQKDGKTFMVRVGPLIKEGRLSGLIHTVITLSPGDRPAPIAERG